MNGLKSKFITVYITVVMIAMMHSVVMITSGESGEFLLAWVGVALATVPHSLFFMKIFLVPTARTSENLSPLVTLGLIGAATAVLSVAQTSTVLWLPLFYAVVVGAGGNLVYVFWYSRFGRGSNELLQEGKQLPHFILENESGDEVLSSAFMGSPSVIMFYRGNWCPLCMAQIKEIAAQYKSMADRGVQVILVSPQSHRNTASLAKKFDVPFQFLVDKNNTAAKLLNIDSQNGTPMGLEVLGYDGDTVMPTVLITNAKGKIIFSDLTDNYRVRPEPEDFIAVLEANGISISGA